MKDGNFLRGMGLASGLLIMTCLAGCSEKNPQEAATLKPADLLPASGEISGWTKGTGAGDFGEAEDQNSLYALIDGAAEQYIEYGFVEAVLQTYEGTIGGSSAALELFISDQGSESNVEALFADELVVPNNLTPWDGAGDEAGIDQTLLFQICVYLCCDRFFVRATVDKNGDEVAALSTAQDFVLAVVNSIGT